MTLSAARGQIFQPSMAIKISYFYGKTLLTRTNNFGCRWVGNGKLPTIGARLIFEEKLVKEKKKIQNTLERRKFKRKICRFAKTFITDNKKEKKTKKFG